MKYGKFLVLIPLVVGFILGVILLLGKDPELSRPVTVPARKTSTLSAEQAGGSTPSSAVVRLDSDPQEPGSTNSGYVRKVLDEILLLYTKAMSQRRPSPSGQFQSQAEVHYREGRLLALAYPNEMEKLLVSRSRDTSLGIRERYGCVALLGVLAEAGMKTARATLYELAAGSERALSELALDDLYKTDREGEFLPLYLSKCRQEGWAACDAISCYVDAASIRQLEVIVATSQGDTDGEQRGQAQQALDKIHALNSGDSHRILEGILDGSKDARDWLPWALIMGKRTSLPGYLDCLRRRLDRTETSLLGPQAEEVAKVGINESEDFERGSSSGIGDRFFDHALIAYAEAGGKLTEQEKRRLYTAGYLCDPKKRLEELLSTRK